MCQDPLVKRVRPHQVAPPGASGRPAARPCRKAPGGRQFYRPPISRFCAACAAVLHDEGYTIKGVQRRHREESPRPLVGAGGEGAAPATAANAPAAAGNGLYEALRDLETAKQRLDALLNPH